MSFLTFYHIVLEQVILHVLISHSLSFGNIRKNMLNAKIGGIGYYVPERVVTNHDLEKVMDTFQQLLHHGINTKHKCYKIHVASQKIQFNPVEKAEIDGNGNFKLS